MKVEIKNGITYIYAEPNKALFHQKKNIKGNMFILAKMDSPSHYVEIEKAKEPELANLEELKRELIAKSRKSMQERVWNLIDSSFKEAVAVVAREQADKEAKVMAAITEDELESIK